MNIPIYRARVLGLGNNYIIGFYQQYIEGFEDNVYHEINNTLIDPTTLAIHFPNMTDSQGNKIFASLGEDGKGGDVLYYKSKIDLVTKTTVYFENYRLITHSKGENTFRDKESLSKFEVIGIKE